MPTYSKKEEPTRKPRKIIRKKDKMKVPTITITEAPKKIKKKPKATKPVPPLEKKKFKIKLPKEEEKPKGKGPAKPKIDYDNIIKTNKYGLVSHAEGNGLYSYPKFATKEEKKNKEATYDNVKKRIYNHTKKVLEEIAKKNNIKSTEEFKEFLKIANDSSKLRNLLKKKEYPHHLTMDASKLEKVSLERLSGNEDRESYKGGSIVYIDPKSQKVYDNEEDFRNEESIGHLVSLSRGRGKKIQKGILIQTERFKEFFVKDTAYGYDYGYLSRRDIEDFYTTAKRGYKEKK